MDLFRELAAISSITINCYCARSEVPDPSKSRMRQTEPPPTGCSREIKIKTRANIDSIINFKTRTDC